MATIDQMRWTGDEPSGSCCACFCASLAADFDFVFLERIAVWLAVFFFTPIIEMYLLIEVGGYIGAWPTIALVMITAVIGVALLRVQGLATLTRGLGRLDQGELPAQEMVEGLLLAVAGALLLTPGFVTDFIGFVLLSPPGRALIAQRVLANVQIVRPGQGGFQPPPGFQQRPGQASGNRRPDVIEGEYSSRSTGAAGEPGADGDSHPGDDNPPRQS